MAGRGLNPEIIRHHSCVSLRADGVIAGLGSQGYHAALDAVIRAAASA